MIRKYAEIFCWKNVSSFCSAKATHIFSAKNIRILYIESAKIVNEMTLNELVKLTMFWTTGPRSLLHICKQQKLWQDCTYAQTCLSLCWPPIVISMLSDVLAHFMLPQLWIKHCFQQKSAGLSGSVGCASDWRPGGRGFDPHRGRQHSFMEIDHEIFSTVILSLPLIQEGQLSVSGERMCTVLVNRLED